MSKRYAIKEIYYTLQGEGAHTGRPAVFVRFSGCNLWSGREQDRQKAICRFCDTDFWGTDGLNGGKYEIDELVDVVQQVWEKKVTGTRLRLSASDGQVSTGTSNLSNLSNPFIVFTGGEPALQLDAGLLDTMHGTGFEVAIETNGTLPLPDGLDWICVSPKAGTGIVTRSGNELKIVYPQDGIDPRDFADWDFEHFFLQPMDSPHLEENTRACEAFCMKNPQWKVSIQMHKVVGLP